MVVTSQTFNGSTVPSRTFRGQAAHEQILDEKRRELQAGEYGSWRNEIGCPKSRSAYGGNQGGGGGGLNCFQILLPHFETAVAAFFPEAG